jgi:membrane dipeptidase
MSDEMIRLLASRGGVIQINFGSEFLEPRSKENPRLRATVRTVADHIDHVVAIAGTGAVGFGSDFDGVGDTLPDGLRDAAGYPNLLAELMRRGYTRDDLRKICGGNLLRVWTAVEAAAEADAAGGDQ